MSSRVGVFRGVDVRADGGYVVAPSSLHVSGRVYQWQSEPTADLPELPPLWVDHLIGAKLRTERTEHTRDYRGIQGDQCAIQRAIGVAIVSSLPTAYGQRHRQVFEFARAVKAITPDAPMDELKVYVKQWFREGKARIRTKAFEETWADFVSAWKRVTFPKGSGHMVELLDRAAKEVPIIAHQYDLPATRLLVSLCRELQREAGQKPFFLSGRMAGELVGLCPRRAADFLHMFVVDGVLKLEDAGDCHTHKAAQYRYLGD